MAKRSKVLTLPADVKAWLDQALVESNFSGYELLSAELKKAGYEISKSSLHRYASPFEERLAQVRLAGDQAKAVIDASPDDDNTMNESLIRLTQERILVLLAKLQADGEEFSPKTLGHITKAIADLGRASVQQKKYRREVEARTAQVAKDIEGMAIQGGWSDETVERVKGKIMGIVA